MTKQLTFDLNGNRTGGNRETELTVTAITVCMLALWTHFTIDGLGRCA